MDIELADPECIPEPTYDDEYDTQKWRVRGHGLEVEGKITSLRTPYVAKIGLFKDDSRLYVDVHTPGNGCYRCDKFFSIVKPVSAEKDEVFHGCPCSGKCCEKPDIYCPEHKCVEDICEWCYATVCRNCGKECCCDL